MARGTERAIHPRHLSADGALNVKKILKERKYLHEYIVLNVRKRFA